MKKRKEKKKPTLPTPHSVPLTLTHLYYSLSHTPASISSHLLPISILWLLKTGLHDYSTRRPLRLSQYDSSILFISPLFWNILLKFLCFTLHIPTLQMSTLHFFEFSRFLLKLTETEIRPKLIDSQLFQSISVENFTNRNFRFRLVKHKENWPNRTNYIPRVY